MLERGVPLRDETVDQRSLRSSAAAAGCPSAALGWSPRNRPFDRRGAGYRRM